MILYLIARDLMYENWIGIKAEESESKGSEGKLHPEMTGARGQKQTKKHPNNYKGYSGK